MLTGQQMIDEQESDMVQERYFEHGSEIRAGSGKTYVVEKKIGEGGQGIVYRVSCEGKPYALKWYKPYGLGTDPDAFYNNLKKNVENGRPDSSFLWPLDLTERINGSFGYVMELRPEHFYDVTDYMTTNVRFSSYKVAAKACGQIISAFRILHNAGYSYQDINDGNFFIDPETGDVLICDNDNVAPDGFYTGIIGKPRYMAPEIVVGMKDRAEGREGKMPDTLSDRHSLAVILFIILTMSHPLEGKKSLVDAMSPEMQEKLYGTHPLFVMDPEDRSNGPDEVVHRNLLSVWSSFPAYLREMFQRTFSRDALRKPERRPPEVEWLQALLRFGNEIVECECGNEVFIDAGVNKPCEVCGKMTAIHYRIRFPKYAMAIGRGTFLYRGQFGLCDAKEAARPVARVSVKKNDSGTLAFRNSDTRSWQYTVPGIGMKKIMPDQIAYVGAGCELCAYDIPAVIERA